MGTLHEDQYTFLITSRSLLLRMKNVSEKICGENRNTHFMFNISFKKLCHLWDVEKMLYSVADHRWQYGWHMLLASWIPKATNTHSGCVILIAFSLQEWLHECASMSHYTYTACLVYNSLMIINSKHH